LAELLELRGDVWESLEDSVPLSHPWYSWGLVMVGAVEGLEDAEE